LTACDSENVEQWGEHLRDIFDVRKRRRENIANINRGRGWFALRCQWNWAAYELFIAAVYAAPKWSQLTGHQQNCGARLELRVFPSLLEGARYHRGKLLFRSADPDHGFVFKTDFLAKVFPLKEGDLFSGTKIRKSREDFRKLYGEWLCARLAKVSSWAKWLFRSRTRREIPGRFRLPGVAATNRCFEVPMVAIARFRDGKLAHEHIYWDQASVLKRIGLMTDESLPATNEIDTSILIRLARRDAGWFELSRWYSAKHYDVGNHINADPVIAQSNFCESMQRSERSAGLLGKAWQHRATEIGTRGGMIWRLAFLHREALWLREPCTDWSSYCIARLLGEQAAEQTERRLFGISLTASWIEDFLSGAGRFDGSRNWSLTHNLVGIYA
jgi:hypothetical protein